MSWTRMEDTESKPGSFWAWTGNGDSATRMLSTKTIALTTWKCSGCGAWACGHKGEVPTACLRCANGG